MKSNLNKLVCIVACLLSLPTAHAGYVNYIFKSGGNLFNNPLDDGAGNDLNTVFTPPPIGTAVSLWNAGTQSYTQTSIYKASGWTIDLTIAPGTAMVVTAPSSFLEALIGTVVNPDGTEGAPVNGNFIPPPAFSGPNGIYLWACKTPFSGTISQNIENGYTLFDYIVGRDPQVGEKIWTYNDSNGAGFVEDDYTATGWSNPNQTLTVGEAAFFQIGSGNQGTPYLPTIVPEPTTLALADLGGLATLIAARRRK